MTGQFADAVRGQILAQASGVVIYAGLGDTGIAETVSDNNQNQNRSTNNIVAWLQANGYSGISIDAEGGGMSYVAELVTQLGQSFKAAGLIRPSPERRPSMTRSRATTPSRGT